MQSFPRAECFLVELIQNTIAWMRAVDPGVAGGWLLFIDMILCATLFMFWEKAGRIGRAPSKR